MTVLKDIEKRRFRHAMLLYHKCLIHNHAYLTPPLFHRDTTSCRVNHVHLNYYYYYYCYYCYYYYYNYYYYYMRN